MESGIARPVILARYLPTIFFILLLVLSYFVIKPFLFTLIFSVILAYLLTPLHIWIQKRVKNPNASALILIILLALVLSIGGFFFVKTVVNEARSVYFSLRAANIGPEGFEEIFNSPYIKTIFEKTTLTIINKGTEFLVSLPLFFLNIVIMLFVLFYAFKEKNIGRKIVDVLPLRASYKESLYNEIKKVSKLVLYGFIVVGLIQGIIGGLSFWIFGVPNPLFWTVVMIVASILPIGPWLVWVPAAIFKFIAGDMIAAFGLALFGFVITNNIDLFLRPLLVSKKANIHPLIVLIGGLGGILAFGIIGLIIGPLIIAFTISFLKVYREEQKRITRERERLLKHKKNPK
ncbi:MAG: AI-2E family transporter [Nanoarchaeota archaeon]|nr:AI-2E family transporter [Nanoarchaeota archaeon]